LIFDYEIKNHDATPIIPRRPVLPVGHAQRPVARRGRQRRGLPPLQVRFPWPLSPWTLGRGSNPEAQWRERIAAEAPAGSVWADWMELKD